MLLKNRKIKQQLSGNVVEQFDQFRRDVLSSGKNPQQILNELLSSGKITKSQLDNATNIARQFSHLIK